MDVKDAELLNHIRAFCHSKPKGDKRLIAVLEFLFPFFNQDNFNGCWCIRSMAEVSKENQRVRLKIKSNKKKFLVFLKQLVIENKPQLNLIKQEQLSNQLYLLYEGALTECHIHHAEWPIETSIVILRRQVKRKIIFLNLNRQTCLFKNKIQSCQNFHREQH